MIREIKTKNFRRKSNSFAILTVKKIYNKIEIQRFINEWEEITKKGSHIKTVMLNDEVIEFKGFVRKVPRIAFIPKAARKVAIKHFAEALDKTSNEKNKEAAENLADRA